jgi:phenylalanyl-tRNA synthetase beta chain
VRQYVVCGILRGITFTPRSYNSFIDLQEKLHQNICRRRTLVSVGTHDLDTIQGPFSYEALPPEEIKFAPLNRNTVMNGHELMENLSKDLHLKQYLYIIKDGPTYPVIYDANRVVLSLPPIINGDHSKITLNTKNVFIEVTATDLTKAQVVLNTICAMFGEYLETPFTFETVESIYPDNRVEVYPNISSRAQTATVEYINRLVGFNPPLGAEEICRLLGKMTLPAEKLGEGEVVVHVPCTRSDILHACDVMEDVAIAFGFNNLTKQVPGSVTIGRQQPLNKLTDLLRVNIAAAGYLEVLNFILCSHADNFDKLLRADDGKSIAVGNPKGDEFQTCRRNLLSGILKSISHNRGFPLPFKLFEIGDVVIKDDTSDVGARNHRHMCAVLCDTKSSFETVHGLLDRVMVLLGIPYGSEKSNTICYYLQPSSGSSPRLLCGCLLT